MTITAPQLPPLSARPRKSRLSKADMALKSFEDRVYSMAKEAGAEIVPDPYGVGDEFHVDTPIGKLKGRPSFDMCILMRFIGPVDGVPAVAVDDFNRHSHKWNILGSDLGDDALAELARRLRWVATGA